MRKLLAFMLRDVRIARSYKLNFVLALGAGVVTLTSVYFLARTVGEAGVFRHHYGVDYFSFALVGVAVVGSLRALQTSFAQRLRETQVDGSLEVLFGAPISTLGVVAGLAAFPILMALTGGLLLLGFGAVFGATLHVNPASLLLTLALSALTFIPVGLLSAAYTLVFKRGDPFTYALDALSYLVSGVIYPVEVLPRFLRVLALCLPTTHAIAALRGATLQAATPAALGGRFLALGLFAAVLWPLATTCLTLARRHVERTGTLPQS